ncbi:mycofactocin-coupled SDR family oxidoreductase [Pseudonocardia xishanensis]|uniref:Mycofactocin-coupled SDR family oxidoreductase n=1 Tax=Pseudonocardia xishanensis TaxID=630995 RepID=A0ABP8RRG3_9PSEU
MGRFTGRTAFITGAARGQGRSHALRLAAEGADIVAIDICAQIESATYDLATPEDLDETVGEIEKLDRRVIPVRADVRDLAALEAAAAEAVDHLGGIDVVIANAGIAPSGPTPDAEQTFREVIDVNLVGVWNTLRATAPTMIEQGRGGAVVLISSVLGLSGRGSVGNVGGEAYVAAKHGVTGLMKAYANRLAPHAIRVNSIHPTGVPTPMIDNEAVRRFAAETPEAVAGMINLMDVPWVETQDVSAAIAWVASDEGRYVTGVSLPVDAGFLVK